MSISRNLFFLSSFLLILSGTNKIRSQSQVAIVLNEYCATNINGPGDSFGDPADWVEIYNAHTSSVSLGGYYLSNDRKNLKKWAFPGSFVMPVNSYEIVWLTGKNTVQPISPGGLEYHANFTIDQCKNQWLILSTAAGTIRDSIFVQQSKAGHSRGRIDYTGLGINYWRLYTTPSQRLPNPTGNNYSGYVPSPKLILATLPEQPVSTYTSMPNKGGFYEGAQIGWFKLQGVNYDTTFFPCTNLWYTINGDYPRPGVPGTVQYYDSISGSPALTLDRTTIVRFIAVPNPKYPAGCAADILPSFCESNTYFIDPAHQIFNSRFGVVSIALDNYSQDTTWFNAGGNPPSTTIHVEYYDNKQQMSEGYGLLTKPPQEAWKTQQRGFYITIDDKNGFGCNFEGPIFNVEPLGTSSRTVFPTLHMKGGDLESYSRPLGSGANVTEGSGLRDVLIQSLAIKYNINVNPLHFKPVVTFVNGKYWGVFNFAEVYDKYYEKYYNQQSPDSVNLRTYHANSEGWVRYHDNTTSSFGDGSSANFMTKVYKVATQFPMNSEKYYNQVMGELDKESFIDWMIVNSYAMNSDLWSYNIGFAKGGQAGRPGYKWHYYLWNMPSTFNFTAIANSPTFFNNLSVSPCVFHKASYPVGLLAGNGHGIIFNKLMNTTDYSGKACGKFQLQYKNRYQDLMNTAFKCENILRQWDTLRELYFKEMTCHGDPACEAGPGVFTLGNMDNFDSCAVKTRKALQTRCYVVENYFKSPGCFGATGPYNITVDVVPAGAGKVKLNSIILDTYPWSGNYYSTLMSFKAIPTNTTFAFHHWEFKFHTPKDPASLDSVSVAFAMPDNVIAVFTDKSRDIETGVNIPTAFTPNDTGPPENQIFRPLGAAEYASEYQMTIWNRWGQEVFRSVDPLNGWDGNYRGQQAITGVYAYLITYKNIYGESKVVKGNVTLTR